MGNWLSKVYFVLSLKFPEGLMEMFPIWGRCMDG